ncbi:thialysine N-epsilon-acetyltransferase-like isoform X2 [Elgaria multicarinata webbii]|uniref:thialysine N-epsilon-acetyltransferase-like isoform X2 n=1 Tax=Elgaria multicarinata webbii TaxID=159646 RepID=UPI002FCD221A
MAAPAVSIRACRAEDCADIVRMIRELAEFENLSEQVKISDQGLCEDGFCQDPFYKCVVAEVPRECQSKDGHTLIGYGLYFFTYSTWKGRNIYMEDLKRNREETHEHNCPDWLGAGLHADEVFRPRLESPGHRLLPQQRGHGPDSHGGMARLPLRSRGHAATGVGGMSQG